MSVDPKENIDGAVSSQSLTSAICKLSSNSETISSSVNTSILNESSGSPEQSRDNSNENTVGSPAVSQSSSSQSSSSQSSSSQSSTSKASVSISSTGDILNEASGPKISEEQEALKSTHQSILQKTHDNSPISSLTQMDPNLHCNEASHKSSSRVQQQPAVRHALIPCDFKKYQKTTEQDQEHKKTIRKAI